MLCMIYAKLQRKIWQNEILRETREAHENSEEFELSSTLILCEVRASDKFQFAAVTFPL